MKGILKAILITALFAYLNAGITAPSLVRTNQVARNVFTNPSPLVGGENSGVVKIMMQSGSTAANNIIRAHGGTSSITNNISNNSISFLQRHTTNTLKMKLKNKKH